jgi:hypothetical protein
MDALIGLAAAVEHYASLPIQQALTWADCAEAIPPGDWYLVAFRSVQRAGADVDRLRLFDDLAHAEAEDAHGFVHYFKGPLAADGSCLSFCLWTSREEARSAAVQPAHREAVSIIAEMYESYTLEFMRVRKRDASAALEFEPHDGRPEGSAKRTSTAPLMGLSPASS